MAAFVPERTETKHAFLIVSHTCHLAGYTHLELPQQVSPEVESGGGQCSGRSTGELVSLCQGCLPKWQEKAVGATPKSRSTNGTQFTSISWSEHPGGTSLPGCRQNPCLSGLSSARASSWRLWEHWKSPHFFGGWDHQQCRHFLLPRLIQIKTMGWPPSRRKHPYQHLDSGSLSSRTVRE